MKISYISGYFEIFHAGHLRILHYAKSISDKLVVGVYDFKDRDLSTTLEKRIDEIQKSGVCDEIVVIRNDELEALDRIRPDYIIKSPEHRGKVDEVQKHCLKFGTPLIFTSANIIGANFKKQEKETSKPNLNFPKDFVERHSIDKKSVQRLLDKFNNLNVFVLGDSIIDEYVNCHPIGMSQEDPTLVVSPQRKERFLGGAGIVAAHIAGLGACVDFASIVGADEDGTTVGAYLDQYNVNYRLFVDSTRKTTLKQRFRANGKTLLRVSNLNDHDIDEQICNKIYSYLKSNIKKFDLIVLSDFNYGVLPTDFANKISSLAKRYDVPIVADSQASSQVSDISRFKNLTFLTPTEHEVQLALNDRKSNLVILAEKLTKKVNSDIIAVTLGSEGILILNKLSGIKTDRIGAINSNPTDPAGAGDSFLAGSSLALAAGSNVWEASLIGSFIAAHQVNRIGNLPANMQELRDLFLYLE